MRFTASLSIPGLLLATLFFAASLTPSLLPRTFVTQGMLSGFSLSAGYGLGVFFGWLWSYLELPSVSGRWQRFILYVASLLCVAVALVFLWQANSGQNAIRALMELEPVDTAHPFRVGGIALLVFVVLLAVARLFHLSFSSVAGWLKPHVPRRVANVLGVIITAAVFWSVADGVLFQYSLRLADASYQQVDALIEAEQDRPLSASMTGSDASLLDWEGLGRRGRQFVAGVPDAQVMSSFFGEAVMQPLRVYVGLNSAADIEERVQLALAELERVGAFERSVLVLITPTGTGWVDPGAIDTLEYLHRGDVASVAVQYSYLPSWLSLLAEPEYGAETARAMFVAIYDRWSSLPREQRPQLYLHGLSLGALNSERAGDIYDVIADPFSGAVWSGPPFRSTTWRSVTMLREPGSPAWLPRFRDGSIVRFMNQQSGPAISGASWGPIRIVYLQYASDPITFFEPQSFYRQPEWMNRPRGPDVSPRLRWFPVVTMLQLAVDMAAADQAPRGYGHVYSPLHYLDAWLEVSQPAGWTMPEIARLKCHLAAADPDQICQDPLQRS